MATRMLSLGNNPKLHSTVFMAHCYFVGWSKQGG